MAFKRPQRVEMYLTNEAYGFPRGAQRRVKPTVLHVLHITGNKNTASMKVPDGTIAEIRYMNRRDSNGPSAHDYVARNGTIFRCVDPDKHAAWSNGDLTAPLTQYPGVKRLVAAAKRSTNPNDLCYREVEYTGYPGSYPLTKEQRESAAWQIARDSIRTGLPIVAGDTVLLHAFINSVNRASCPFTGDRFAQLKRICDRANAIKDEMTANPPPPDPPDEPPPPPPDPCAADKEQVAVLTGLLETARAEGSEMAIAIEGAAALLQPFTEDSA